MQMIGLLLFRIRLAPATLTLEKYAKRDVRTRSIGEQNVKKILCK